MAVAIACRPATPAPMTKTRAAATVPAAVLSIGNMRGRVAGGEQHGLVAGDRGHRRQRVHALRARDARHQLHRDERRAALGDRSRGVGRRQRIGEADDDLVRCAAARRRRRRRPDSRRASRTWATISHWKTSARDADRRACRRVSGDPGIRPRRRRRARRRRRCRASSAPRVTAGTIATRRSPGNVSLGTPIFMAARV